MTKQHPNSEMFRIRTPKRSRSGTILAMTAVMILIVIVAAVFTVDVAYMQLTKTELRIAADAAAKAAGYTLGEQQDVTAARQAAIQAAAANVVAGAPLQLEAEDIVFGHSSLQENGKYNFEPNSEPRNSVRVFARRDEGSASGSVRLLLGRLLGTDVFEPVESARTTRLDRDIVIVVDRSGSMAWDLSDVDWSYPPPLDQNDTWTNYLTPPHPTDSRWAVLEDAVGVFLDSVAQTQQIENVALVSYSEAWSGGGISVTTVDTNQGLTGNYNLVSTAVSSITAQPVVGGTNISAGIDRAVELLTSSSARPHVFKTMIVMTDGVWNAGQHPVLSAESAADENITIHSITFSAGADQNTMQDVAEVGAGNHYHAPHAEALADAFEEIAFTLPVILTE